MAFKIGERAPGASITTVEATHDCKPGAWAYFDRGCGVFVCGACGEHKGLARCFCGWSASGGNGRYELEEMGERIDDDY